ncbi:hypothetical protein ACVNPS_01485 [Candidatus Bipolaricaulota sp. J31]
MSLVLGFSLFVGTLAKDKEPVVEVRARIGGTLMLSIESGEEISFEVDPLNNPEDTAQTELLVITNLPAYSITALFSEFVIEEFNYDLIANGKFFIRTTPPGTGDGIPEWTVPHEGEVVLVKFEDGFTPGEVALIEYKLSVDFSVPPGEGKMKIVFTAVPEI